MEFRRPIDLVMPPCSSIEDYFVSARDFCEQNYSDQLAAYRGLYPADVGPQYFWQNYCWVVYTSGFNAGVVTTLFPELMIAYDSWYTLVHQDRWALVCKVFANRRKYDACVQTAQLMYSYELDTSSSDWWVEFRSVYSNPSALQRLPYIGPVTCYHLARNIGLDEIKPDLHINRLTDYFDWPDPESMCSFLSGLFNERLGVVDLILWYAASSAGTLEFCGGRT